MKKFGSLFIIALIGLLASGCSGKLFFAGNLAVAAIPCVLLYLTVNIDRNG